MKNFWKRRTIIILAAAALFCLPVAFINYMVDPYWCFSHKIPIGSYQTSIDERQQKTNFLTTRTNDLDTIILGNSRVTYTDVRSIPGKAFNYASSSMKSAEFLPYLKYAASRSMTPITTVILGMSFVDANSLSSTSFDLPEEYIEKATSLGFRYKSLLNFKLLHHSIASIKREINGLHQDAYVWDGGGIIPSRQMMLPVPVEAHRKAIVENLAVYRERAYSRDFVYQDNRPIYEELKRSFPEARFMVFTTPVSEHLLNLLTEQGLFGHYIQWVRDIVHSFGELWNFMYYNGVTTNGLNYKDAHHYSPEVCDLIIRKLFMSAAENDHADFGIRVTQENLDPHLKFLRENMLQLSNLEKQKQ